MTNDDHAPATKEDIRLLMESIGTFYAQTQQRFASLEDRIQEAEEGTKHHFDLAVETIRHDLEGANLDRIENHEDRISHLERRAGLQPA